MQGGAFPGRLEDVTAAGFYGMLIELLGCAGRRPTAAKVAQNPSRRDEGRGEGFGNAAATVITAMPHYPRIWIVRTMF